MWTARIVRAQVRPQTEPLVWVMQCRWSLMVMTEDGSFGPGTGRTPHRQSSQDFDRGAIMMFWYGHDMSGWGYAWMGIGTVLFWVLMIVGIIAVVRLLIVDWRSVPTVPVRTAEQILADRFARGEIGESDYRDRLDILRREQTST
jgi:putative membrane protein